MISDLAVRLLNLPRWAKTAMIVVADLVVLFVAVWASFALRLSSLDPWQFWAHLPLVSAAPVLGIPALAFFGAYRAVIRFLPERAFWQIAKGMVVASLAWVTLGYLLELAHGQALPRSVPILYAIIGTLMVAGTRFGARALLRPHVGRDEGGLLIVGADAAGVQFMNAARRSSHPSFMGFIDYDEDLHHREVAGARVYPPADIAGLVARHSVRDVVISLPAVTAAQRQEIMTALRGNATVRIRALPSLGEIVSGRYAVDQMRDIDIDELLGRSSVPPDPDLLRRMIQGRNILVSGAGGSIGSELCRLIADLSPGRLVLLEASEYALYRIDFELHDRLPGRILPVLGSVTDDALVRRAIRDNHIAVVFHAAAHKHVPLVERNPLEGIGNNVLGTETIVDAAFDLGVETFVLISTDKAVHPTNVMGATKRWAELLVRSKAEAARVAGTGQRFTAVRFGNVLGSNGSVVPLFQKQIRAGGPVTLTDPEMTRYFMSIHEAAELIVQAGALAEGGDIFVLEMGSPMRIAELAENMVQLAGYSVRDAANPEGQIELVVIGIRPGEKLHEELFYDRNSVAGTRHPKILRTVVHDAGAGLDIDGALAELTAAVKAGDEARARTVLFGAIRSEVR
jgi:FlaA1/EpsC-like NDP-sugar epimerase